MYTAIKLSQRQKHMPLNTYVSLYEQVNSDSEDKQTTLIEQLETSQDNNPEEVFLDKEWEEAMEQALEEKLSEFERRVLHLHLIGEDYRSIAKLLDKTPKSIDNALQRIKQKTFDILTNLL
jgi:RNA polymerase sporulation-specific sigma factor